ncbi:hypothetical protein, partial [Roseibium sp. RKSG952]|uniref:hypothetical protein n=1 Tax=Roseibium sp. RKSG952 TaxID=2529384 RepID=UPI001AD8BC58
MCEKFYTLSSEAFPAAQTSSVFCLIQCTRKPPTKQFLKCLEEPTGPQPGIPGDRGVMDKLSHVKTFDNS